jgi:hypothetical protein
VLGAKAFFSFTEVPDPADHRAYNEWHQLDHRPENLALPGVRWGERWVRSPDCAAVAPEPSAELAALHYVNMYWFAEPVDVSTAAWSELAERSFHWGRRDDVRIARRLLMGFFRPVKGYVNPRVLVSADALPIRPNRGVHVTVARIDEPRAAAAEALFGWYDRVRIPAMLGCRGGAGAWTFAADDTFATALDLAGAGDTPSTLRLTLVYLDDDPLAFTDELAALPVDHDTSPETILFAGPLRSITPWDWDWFC